MPELSPEFDALLLTLKQTRRVDFTGYKRASLWRRFEKRMQTVGAQSLAEYGTLLESAPEEAQRLLDTVLIHVTGFFRDRPAWDMLAEDTVPRLLAQKNPDEPIRLWSAGCATGEEAYSLAMLFAEAMGLDAFRRRVKIYATDLDDGALALARSAMYTSRAVAGVPPPLLDKYFTQVGANFCCAKDLRRAVIFARHDLLRDAPISRLDLLACRNTLMYFTSAVQNKLLANLHFALRDNGVLFVGKAEMLATHGSLFSPLDLKRRLFAKVPKVNTRERIRLMAQAGIPIPGPLIVSKPMQMQDVVFEGGSIAQIVIDSGGLLSLVNEQARALFPLTADDLGRPLQDLEVSYRPAELRSLMQQAYAERVPISRSGILWPKRDGTVATLELLVTPLMDAEGALLGASVTFADVTPYKNLTDEFQATHRELETAYEELQSTNEELETTYEELQSTIEELETTNEELHSTNEELETMNEELQSTNDALQTVNDEAQQRGDELNSVNDFMNAILSSLQGGVAVLDEHLQVQVWNARMEELWGLRAAEAQGRHFWNLDIGLPVERLKQPIRDCLTGHGAMGDMALPSHNRRGKEFLCHVTITPLTIGGEQRQGVILLMDEDAPKKQTSGSDGHAPAASAAV